MHLPILLPVVIGSLFSLWVMKTSTSGLVSAPPDFSNGTCTNCGLLDELLKVKNVARIKLKILSKLRLSQRPKPRIQVPEEVPYILGTEKDIKTMTDNSVAETADIVSFSEAPGKTLRSNTLHI